MPVPEGRMMLLDLMDHVTRPEFVHAHEWRKGDLVIWDNRSMLHRARPFDPVAPRDTRRTSLARARPTMEQALTHSPPNPRRSIPTTAPTPASPRRSPTAQ